MIEVEGVEYDAHLIKVQKYALKELEAARFQNVHDFMKVFQYSMGRNYKANRAILYRMSRLAGTSLLEAGFLLEAAFRTRYLSGDWCEYGVAHGRTSAFLAQTMLADSSKQRKLWLYDSFQGLPQPSAKDELINDIFAKGSMAAYQGEISIPESYVVAELASVRQECDFYNVVKGWITPDLLAEQSPNKVALAFLDMDFYQSTLDVLAFLAERMEPGGIAIVDDYGVFSSGVQTAVQEVLSSPDAAFKLEHPFEDKFVLLTRK